MLPSVHFKANQISPLKAAHVNFVFEREPEGGVTPILFIQNRFFVNYKSIIELLKILVPFRRMVFYLLIYFLSLGKKHPVLNGKW